MGTMTPKVPTSPSRSPRVRGGLHSQERRRRLNRMIPALPGAKTISPAGLLAIALDAHVLTAGPVGLEIG